MCTAGIQEWRGGLGPSASIILRQFAAHRGLRPAVTDVCLWTAYVTVMQRRTLDFSVMHDLLLRLDSAFNDSKLPEETSQIFWAAADKFIENVLHVVRHLRSNPKLRTNPTNLISLLQCVSFFSPYEPVSRVSDSGVIFGTKVLGLFHG